MSVVLIASILFFTYLLFPDGFHSAKLTIIPFWTEDLVGLDTLTSEAGWMYPGSC
ncbi:hypothetical protein IQ226_20795 [Dolichospermum sp. LEGE 00240]|uniref:hypothetical protein n=1 Tax=Dolichospermum sp. LEGE 00240 TaxID=1828603 RepID=UPI00187F8E20|nr:hypothetical protein [Dolichospermum sp. LEGE 00240]MBE9251521.1 hypothetical protein [Dolichospermum sp. LEGE 00240]MDM3845950.1 hypothetical protein [Aphanizomenon gracile PMC638.10]MDM3852874.1 hypothetical protein [Aphanizomenon gracile PMC627.10]MDM3857410.1 hypothetical protein [Aphanizomenon gracile PMC649.10]